MDIEDGFNMIPFARLVGVELLEAEDGHAVGRVPHTEDVVSSPTGEVLHGGVTYTLADTVGGAAAATLAKGVTPTIDMRMDYLAPATTDIRCEADVVRQGGSVAMVRADVYDADDAHVATAHGVYKTAGQGEETPWGDETAVPGERGDSAAEGAE